MKLRFSGIQLRRRMPSRECADKVCARGVTLSPHHPGGIYIIKSRQDMAAGYFLDPTEGGSVLLDPNSLSDLKTGVTSRDLACSSACLRVSHGFEPP
jgi:hypothetical protein